MKRVKKIHPEGIKNPDMVPAFFFKALVVWAAKKFQLKKNHTHTHSLKMVFSYSCPPSKAPFFVLQNQESRVCKSKPGRTIFN